MSPAAAPAPAAAPTSPRILLVDDAQDDREVDGTEVCRHLRRHPEHDKTAVVTLTALPLQSPAIDTMIDAGSDAVLVKPCAPELLLAEIRRVMQRGRLQRQRSAAQSARATE